MPPKQADFDFPDQPKGAPKAEPPRPVRLVKPQSTSICAYCGQRVPSALLDSTPPVNDNRWVIAAPYHAPTRRWIATKGLRVEPPIDSPRQPV